MAYFTRDNLQSALSSTRKANPVLHAQIRTGQGMVNAGKAVSNAASKGMSTAGQALLSPAPSVMGQLLAPADKAFGIALKYPKLSLLASALPVSFMHLRDTYGNKMIPRVEREINLGREPMTEGKTVYAHDKTYNMVKKAHLISKIKSHLKNSDTFEKRAVDSALIRMFLGGMLNTPHSIADKPMNPVPMGNMASAGLGALGGGVLSKSIGSLDRPLGTLGYKMDRGMFDLSDRIRADETFATSAVSTMGSSVGNALGGLLTDMASKAFHGAQALMSEPRRRAMLENIRKTDEVLASADPKELMAVYHTMTKFAPTLSMDANAVRSFLREGLTVGGGLNYMSIANLAQAEERVRKSKIPIR